MLTPTQREVAITPPAKLVPGAQLWGGRYDGTFIQQVIALAASRVVLLARDGSEIALHPATQIAWLHPAGRKA